MHDKMGLRGSLAGLDELTCIGYVDETSPPVVKTHEYIQPAITEEGWWAQFATSGLHDEEVKKESIFPFP